MFKTKICGIKTVDEALAVVEAGGDAIGLNFFSNSRRFVEPRVAEHIVGRTARQVVSVGLFVNAPIETVVGIADAVGLDLIQLHGDEPPELLRELWPRKVIRAFRSDGRGLTPVAEVLNRCRTLGCLPEMVLLDAYVKGEYGGTGAVADWEMIRQQREMLGDVKVVLAGGLTPDNVAEAIAAVKPDAVDTASGVEVRDDDVGVRKDPQLVREFVCQAREAFGSQAFWNY